MPLLISKRVPTLLHRSQQTFPLLLFFFRVLFRDPASIIPSQLLVGANTYDDSALVPPFGTGVATNLTAFEIEIQSDFPDDNVYDLQRTYSPQRYGGSLMNAYSQYQGDKKSFCNQSEYSVFIRTQSMYLVFSLTCTAFFLPRTICRVCSEGSRGGQFVPLSVWRFDKLRRCRTEGTAW